MYLMIEVNFNVCHNHNLIHFAVDDNDNDHESNFYDYGDDYDIENNFFDTDDDKRNNVSHLANDMIFAAAEDCGFSNKSHSACFTHW